MGNYNTWLAEWLFLRKDIAAWSLLGETPIKQNGVAELRFETSKV
jgi:hypothetical protein